MNPSPIFILGISPRSGTNYLSNLIRQHPDCTAPETVWEDYLVCHSDLLLAYTHKVFSRWHWKSGAPEKNSEEKMLAALGDGLLNFLSSDAGPGRLVTKTADVTNIENFFRVFPHACLIILVRDGRAVAESRVKTFRESYDVAIRKWLIGAKAIDSFQRKTLKARFLLVRYEDLWSDVASELRRIFAFCNLDENSYDYATAKRQPVIGSSAYLGEGRTRVHWDPIAQSSDFNPTHRWRHWGRTRHELFNHLAGEHMLRFGYAQQEYGDHRVFWNLFVRVLRLKSKLSYLLHVALREARRQAYAMMRNDRRPSRKLR